MTAEDLKAWRVARGWSQVQMAQAADVSRRSLISYEAGELPIPRRLVLAIERYDLRDALNVALLGFPPGFVTAAEARALVSRTIRVDLLNGDPQ